MRGLYLLSWALALGAGVGLGLFVAWFIAPLSYTNAQPWDLSAHDKDDILKMIASSYAVDNSFARAQQRLYYLQVADVPARVSQLAQAEPGGKTQQALLHLLYDLRQPRLALARATSTPRATRNASPGARVTQIIVVPTRPPVAPATPVVTPIPTPLPPTSEPNPNAARFELVEKRPLSCPDLGGGAAIQVEVQNSAGQGIPGIAVEVNSSRGNEQFFTGLKPERGAGYGDVRVLPGTYTVHLFENARSEFVKDLRIESDVVECSSPPALTQGWALIFRQVP